MQPVIQNSKIVGGIILIWVAVFALYWPTHEFEFLNFDDNEYITENVHVRSGISWENIRWAFTSEHGAHWHPLSWVSHMVDCEIFGVNAGPHHLVNVGIHSTNAALLFLFLVLATGAFAPSLFAALLFGVHPLRLESVAWVTERKDVLSVFFLMLTLLLYWGYTKRRSLPLYVFTLCCYFLSLLAKPTAIVLPFMLLCLDHWPLVRLKEKNLLMTFKSVVLEKVPFFIVALSVALAAVWAQQKGGGLKSLDAYPLGDRIASVLVGYQTYLGKFFIPTGLGIFYPFEQYQPGVSAGVFVSLTLLCFCIWRTREKYPSIVVGWLWFVIALLPMIGILQIGGQAFADRWTYVPHIGLIVGVTWAVRELLRDWPHLLRWISVTVLIGATAMTYQHLPHWRSSEAIFRHTIEVSPDNFMAHMNLGVALDSKGDLNEAARQYDIAVTLKPTYPDALNNLGGARARLGDLQNAEYFFKRALSSAPDFVPAKYNLGLVFTQTGRLSQGVLQWVQAFGINSYYPQLAPSLVTAMKRAAEQGCAPFLGSSLEVESLKEVTRIVDQLPDSDLKIQLRAIVGCVKS